MIVPKRWVSQSDQDWEKVLRRLEKSLVSDFSPQSSKISGNGSYLWVSWGGGILYFSWLFQILQWRFPHITQHDWKFGFYFSNDKSWLGNGSLSASWKFHPLNDNTPGIVIFKVHLLVVQHMICLLYQMLLCEGYKMVKTVERLPPSWIL